MITRRTMLAGMAACGAPAVTLAASGRAQELTAADVHVAGYPTVEAVRWISTRLAKETDGRLRIRVYHSGQLGRESDTVELARVGAIDITRVFFGAINNPFPLTRLFSLPYVFESVGHLRRAVDGEVGSAVLRDFGSRDLVGLAIYDSGSRSFYNVRRPVLEPGDLRGLKIRVAPSDIFIALVRALGANPTPLPYGEVYSSLQTHLIDGAENNWPSYYSSRQFEVAQYFSATAHSYAPEALLMSRSVFDALAPADRDLLIAIARESVDYMRTLWDRAEADARTAVLAAGVVVQEPDLAAFRQASQPVIRSHVDRGELAPLYAAIRALA